MGGPTEWTNSLITRKWKHVSTTQSIAKHLIKEFDATKTNGNATEMLRKDNNRLRQVALTFLVLTGHNDFVECWRVNRARVNKLPKIVKDFIFTIFGGESPEAWNLFNDMEKEIEKIENYPHKKSELLGNVSDKDAWVGYTKDGEAN